MIIGQKRLRNAMLGALADERASKVIACAIPVSRTVAEFVKDCGIPHTSAYRLVNDLKKHGLLIVERTVLAEDGKKYDVYRSTFKDIVVRFESGNVEVDATLNGDVLDKALKIFYSLSGEESQ